MKIGMMWQSLRIAQKIWCGLSILILGYFASMTFGFVLGQHTESRLYEVEMSLFPAAIHSQQALSAFNNQITRYQEAVMAGDPDLLESAEHHAFDVTQSLEAIVALAGLPQEHRETVQETLEQVTAFTTSAQTVYAAMSDTSDDQNALAVVADLKQQASELAQHTETLRQTLEGFSMRFAEMLKTEVSAIRDGSKQNRYWNVAVFALVVSLVMVLVRVLITRWITRPVATLVATAHAIAQGDVSQELHITGQDEIGELAGAFRHMGTTIQAVLHETEQLIQAIQAGQLTIRGNADTFQGGWRDLVEGVNGVINAFVTPINVTAEAIDQIANGDLPEPITGDYQGEFNTITMKLNTMSLKLKEVVFHVKAAADMVAISSNEVRQTSEHMSQSTTEQAAAAEEVSSSMEQMAANIRQNADNARQTEHIALQSRHYAEESGTVVAEAVVAMQQIARKIMIIQEIAAQTRMLSLNATIEAVRAQEHGKAFSVVASEVRKLSDITKTAAEEINELASSSLDISEKAGGMLKTLVPNIQKTAELVQEISAASGEQSAGAAQVNKAIQQLDQITQQNSITAEQMSSTAEELARQASQLQQTIAFFRVDKIAEERQERETRKTTVAEDSSTAGVNTPVMIRKNQPGNGMPRLVEDTRSDKNIFDIEQDEQDEEFERY